MVDKQQQEHAKAVMHERLSSLTEDYVLSLFAEVNSSETSIYRIKDIIDELSKYIGFMTVPVAMHRFYRARLWNEKTDYPLSLAELLEPSAKFATQQRCNVSEKPVLYVSTHPAALILECHLEEGHIFAMAQFERSLKTEDLSCLPIGIDPHQKFPERRELDDAYKFKRSFFGSNFEMYEFIQAEIHKQFVRDDDTRGIAYQFTANLCDKYLTTLPSIDAILYPSIATRGAVANLAIRPELYKKAYVGKKVGIFQVLSTSSFRQLVCANVNPDGSIDWNNTTRLDEPSAASVRAIDPNDQRVFIAPWKQG